MSSEVRSSHLKPPPPQELQRILADLYSSRKEDKLHTEGHKSVALVMEQQSGGNSSGPNVGQTNNNRAGDEESGMYDDNDDDDEEEEEEEVQTPWSTELVDVDFKDDDGQKDREYTEEELARASAKAKRRFNAWQKKVHDQAAGTALTYSIEVQDWEGWCRAEEGQYLKGYLVPHGKKRHGYLVRRVVEPFCNRSIHLP